MNDATVVASVRVVFVGLQRRAWVQPVWYLLTLGISRRVWLYRVHKEIDGHEALALPHRLYAVLLFLPALGPSLVTYLVARHGRRMIQGRRFRHGPAWLLWAASLVPILGNAFFLAWMQGRLNRFWAAERAHPSGGVELDVEVGADPGFLVELDRARRESYFAGSRFDRRRLARRAWLARRAGRLRQVQAERRAVREAGGSVPVLPFQAPRRPRPVRLAVTCGRCATKFAVQRDPTAETPIVCPKCALAEVIPALWENPRRQSLAAVPTVRAKCPRCGTSFEAVRNLFGPTRLLCPSCGRQETFEPAVRGAGAS